MAVPPTWHLQMRSSVLPPKSAPPHLVDMWKAAPLLVSHLSSVILLWRTSPKVEWDRWDKYLLIFRMKWHPSNVQRWQRGFFFRQECDPTYTLKVFRLGLDWQGRLIVVDDTTTSHRPNLKSPKAEPPDITLLLKWSKRRYIVSPREYSQKKISEQNQIKFLDLTRHHGDTISQILSEGNSVGYVTYSFLK